MTKKQEAEQWVNQFRYFADGTDDESDRFSPAIEKENGKKCALLALEKVVEYCNKLGVYSYKHQKELTQLKQEIEKL
jgi:hypothetical protein